MRNTGNLTMSINLKKGEKLSLEKDNKGLTKVFMGLGWDPVKPDVEKKKGFFSSLFGGGGSGSRSVDIDLDASVIVIDDTRKIIDAISFAQLKSKSGSGLGAIRHGGDNLTGEGDGDDETIYVDLPKLNNNVKFLVFTVNSFSGQTFNDVKNAVARLVDHASTPEREICKYTLTDQGSHTAVVMASLEKTGTGWMMTAHGVPGRGRTVRDMGEMAKEVL